MDTWRIISPSAARWVILRSHGPGATEFTALEDKIWQEASSWKGYCERIARTAADLGHEGFLRVLHELGGDAVRHTTWRARAQNIKRKRLTSQRVATRARLSPDD